MDRTQKTMTMADVAGWGSALVTFGLVQGALYLKAYWGHFGLDPFQFVAVSELALAGLAGIGMVLLFMLFAALLGGWIEGKVTADTTVPSLVMWLILVLCLAGLGAIIWWSNGWPLLIGGSLVGVCAVAVRLSDAGRARGGAGYLSRLPGLGVLLEVGESSTLDRLIRVAWPARRTGAK